MRPVYESTVAAGYESRARADTDQVRWRPVVGHLWALMQYELTVRCRELYLVGYSLREGDLRSFWLFRKAAVEGRIERVVVVDPSEEVFARVQSVFGAQRVERVPGGIVEFAGTLAS